jgi:Zn-dependent peptidase ImmA (M78 family)
MRAEPVFEVQPTVMRWARETIGMSLDDVAASLKRPVEEIEAWELGSSAPSYPQLEKLAYQIYKRPLAVFFLPSPPEEATPTREFRSLPYADLQHLLPDTHMQIRRAHAYQIALSELFDGKNPISESILEGFQLSLGSPIEEQAQAVRSKLGISLAEQTQWKDDDFALKEWRQAIEAVGIFVFKSSFKQQEISGFCLFNQIFPIIYLNNSTTKTRQIFSLMHELSHVLLAVNGISKFEKGYFSQLPQAERNVEQFCNALSAEILIPSVDFNEHTKSYSEIEQIGESEFSYLAKRYGVSREAILRRFLDQGRVSKSFYERQAKFWAQQQKPGSGGNWYASQKTYLSDRFAKEVVSRYYRNQLSVQQASDFLGVKAKNFAGLEQMILRGGAA